MRCANLLFVCLAGLSPAALATNWFVSSGQSFQNVLNSAALGDTITLQAGATFIGNFILPNKTTGTGTITIQSSLMSALPAAGQRVSPQYAPYMAKLQAPNGSAALSAAASAHNYTITGVEMASARGIYSGNVVQLGKGTETSDSALPYSIILDQVYIHGDPAAGGKRGVSLNSRSTNITNSYISDFKSTSQDAQAIAGWNGPGPFQILNNYLEASGENVMFGGALATIPNLVPSNIVIRGNHLFKPLSWKKDDPTFAGTAWAVKNSFELKNASDVTFDGNVVENCWPMAQSGIAVQLTVRTQSGTMPWAVVENVMMSNNIFRNVYAGVNILGLDAPYGGSTRGITIENNIFVGSMPGRWLTLLAGWANVLIEHNTVLALGPEIIAFDAGPGTGLTYRNNISPRGGYGIFGSGKSEGNVSLAYYAPGSVVQRNVIAGASAGLYPTGNYFPASIYNVDFVDASSGNYALAAGSPYIGLGTDGRDLGVDFAAVQFATANVVQ